MRVWVYPCAGPPYLLGDYMAGLAGELIEVLNEQLASYRGLVESSSLKKNAIVKNDIGGVKQSNEGEQQHVGRIQRLEKKRQQILEDIASVIGVPYNEITVIKIADKMDGRPEADELRKVAGELKECLGELRAVNDLNSALIQSALEYVDFSMNVMRSTFEDGSEVYNPAGHRSGSAFVDRKN